MTNTVNFPIALGGSGDTYNDGSTAPGNLGNSGHRTNFVPMLSQTVIMSQTAATKAADAAAQVVLATAQAVLAAASAATAASAPGTNATSTSSVAIGLGSKTFTIQAGKSFVAGANVMIADAAAPATNSMFGQITSYSGTTLIVSVTQAVGSGTIADWVISLSGPLKVGVNDELKGADIASAATIDLDAATGNLVHVTGTATITAITLSSGRERTVVFDGILVLTHNASTLIIPGAANITTAAGDSMIVRGDGTAVKVISYTMFGIAPGNSLSRIERTSNTVLDTTNRGDFIDITSGTFSQTFTAAATLGSGWYCFLRNSGTGVITLDPNGAELIDGLSSFPMYGQEIRLAQCDGAAFTTMVMHPFYVSAATTITHIMSPGYKEIEVDLVGAGAGGGSGARAAAGVARAGGTPGGTPARVIRSLRGITAGTSTTVTVGAGGTGGAAIAVDSTDGNNGTAGGNTTFGTLVTAYGGQAGLGGLRTGATQGVGGSGSASAGSSALGGLPRISNFLDNIENGGGGAASAVTNPGGCTVLGGAGACSNTPTGTTIAASGSSMQGVPAGGPGGWITNANAMPATASTAGARDSYVAGGGPAGGTCGASPTAGTAGAAATTDDQVGSSGAGGGSSRTVAASPGGVGGLPGGAGGGGGASENGFASGAGASGANGRAIIKGVV